MENKVIGRSIKWSSLTEIGVKFITPVSTMILARILSPDAFGVLAICSMLISFAEIIADAGFGKYIVQAEFADEKMLHRYASVAFWSHLIMALFLWTIIIIFSDSIAAILGVEGKSNVIIVACSQLVFMSMISTQLGLLRRQFLFKKTFIARISTVCVTICITIPLALILKSYWALIIGNLCGSIVNVFVLTVMSKWYPNLYFSKAVFKDMFGFSFWSLCEGLAHWMIFWLDVFIVTQFYSIYYVGLYKNSVSIMLSFIGMITASMSPVLLSILARLKNDQSYNELYMRICRLFMYAVLPLCVGIFFCRDMVTLVLLGNKWMEAANIIGVWSLMLGVSVFVYSFPAEVYKSKGIPKYLFFYQLSYIVFLVPICIFSAKTGFWEFVYCRAGCVIIQVVLFFVFCKLCLHWNPVWVLNNLLKPVLATFVFASLCFCLCGEEYSIWGKLISVFVAYCCYVILCMTLFRKDIVESKRVLSEKEIAL
ncbi:lipopolysaccharide biosynthesis protein [Butyricimonas sp. Marseille-P3923]|uniref:lipopolysaccharide biosynthesis protein n=1 Tax=Butyricimonas sp. Marseille-P3923 TaxID=1987504 RepID=UPI000C076DBF|nr:lipopolysaccharide biosynthesis protein [Butyricimonas sp. Marseille-P3923]